MKIADDILTIDEVSVYLKIPKSTIYMLTSKALIPFFKVGKQIRFSKESLNVWIKEKEYKNKNKDKRK